MSLEKNLNSRRIIRQNELTQEPFLEMSKNIVCYKHARCFDRAAAQAVRLSSFKETEARQNKTTKIGPNNGGPVISCESPEKTDQLSVLRCMSLHLCSTPSTSFLACPINRELIPSRIDCLPRPTEQRNNTTRSCDKSRSSVPSSGVEPHSVIHHSMLHIARGRTEVHHKIRWQNAPGSSSNATVPCHKTHVT